MTRKDYKAIAEIVSDVRRIQGYTKNHDYDPKAPYAFDPLTEFLAEFHIFLKRDNPNFDKDRFIEACKAK